MDASDRDRSWGPVWRIGLDSTISVRAGVLAILAFAACVAYGYALEWLFQRDVPQAVGVVAMTLGLLVVFPAQIMSFVIALRFMVARLVMHKLIRRRQPFGRLAG
ncbi:MAG: hypothetical protein AAF297_00685 [Planctomycetota bacterium]